MEEETEIKICLCMIVKNESKIIERLLESVSKLVDYVCISDTGSTDNTIEVIRGFCEKNSMEYHIPQHKWENFSKNRTMSYIEASLHFPDADYILLLDADMQLVVEDDFDKSNLKSDQYLIKQVTSASSYYNTRLISTRFRWKCVGVTHEYWECVNKCSKDTIDSIWINDIGDGGCKSDKFERDIRLFNKELGYGGLNTRYYFYLAQSHYDIKEYDSAKMFYEIRSNLGGFKGEVWHSIYRIGQIYENKGNTKKAIKYYHKAIKYNHKRAEPYHRISTIYRKSKDHALAYMYAERALNIERPDDSAELFVEHYAYEEGPRYEMSIVCYYLGYKKIGMQCCVWLIENGSDASKAASRKNISFYK